jgi:hypothetical protein
LVTLSRQLPVTFVDNALRHGDSLVGLDFRQMEAFHWKPSDQIETCRVLLKDALDEAVSLRQQILALAEYEDPTSQSEKRRLLDFAQQAIDRVRIIADACVGAFFAETKDAGREKERKRRWALVEQWLAGDGEDALAAGDQLRRLADDARAKLVPFHWWIEFPEVFFDERPDPLQDGVKNGAALMEGVVGNPPFGGKNNIIDANVDGYLDWLKVVSPEAHGNSDLSAHFFRRAAMLLGNHGAFGLIATNTIAQGDTRTTGLKPLVDAGWAIYDATDSMPWPSRGAAVTVSIVHAARGNPAARLRPILDGNRVDVLNSRLRPKPERPDPVPLRANTNCSFVGSYVLAGC